MRKFLLPVLAGLVALTVVTAVSADNNNVKQKGNLRHGADPFCNLAGYLTIGTEAPDSTFKLSFKSNPNTLTAKVKLKDGLPAETYEARLIQGVSDCFTVDGHFTTNESGKGKLTIEEPALSPGRAVIFLCATPCASDFFASFPILIHGPATASPLAPGGPAAQ
jgi:hypothetical protein